MKGYKVFNPDWTCRGFQFEVGKTFEEDVKPKRCNRGFHFCTKASDCFDYYRFDPNNKVAEVEAVGDIDTHSDDSKCSTNKLHISREITWQEVLELVNMGKGCTGLCNSGNRNSGDCNSGNRNSGNRNSGNRNSGDCNSGNRNGGNWNSGNRNSGNRNSGDCNSGNRNGGNWNSGNWNSGNRNSGDCNSGDYNSGDCNSGNYNSGNRNSGNYNSGDWNTSSFNGGCFNAETHKLKFFDRETDMTAEQWRNSSARSLINLLVFSPTEWVGSNKMTDEEKAAHPEYKTTGGYLKIRDVKNTCRELSEKEKNIIKSIPNFDAKKFYDITGIKIERED